MKSRNIALTKRPSTFVCTQGLSSCTWKITKYGHKKQGFGNFSDLPDFIERTDIKISVQTRICYPTQPPELERVLARGFWILNFTDLNPIRTNCYKKGSGPDSFRLANSEFGFDQILEKSSRSDYSTGIASTSSSSTLNGISALRFLVSTATKVRSRRKPQTSYQHRRCLSQLSYLSVPEP